MSSIFINGKRFEHTLDEIERRMVLADIGEVDLVVLLLAEDDGPDRVLAQGEWIPIREGMRFATFPHGVMGG